MQSLFALKKIPYRKSMFLIVIGILIIVYLVQYNKVAKSGEYESNKLKVLKFHHKIRQAEFRVYSQEKEDGVLYKLIEIFDLNSNKYFVEIGTQSGVQCNTR